VDTLLESVTINDFTQRCILSTVSLFLYAFIDDSENRSGLMFHGPDETDYNM
jgi:hypothetical protein